MRRSLCAAGFALAVLSAVGSGTMLLVPSASAQGTVRSDRSGTLADIERQLRARDYSGIRTIEERRTQFVMEACRDQRRFSLVVTRSSAEITRRERLGWCSGTIEGPRVAGWRRVVVSDLESKRRLTGQQCQDLLASITEDTQILFDKGSAELTPDAHPMLSRIARVANRCPNTRIEVAGHTDSDGTKDLNQVLSERRAQVVVEYLVREGIKLNRLQAVGYGEERPLSRDKAFNRRIELVLDWGT